MTLFIEEGVDYIHKETNEIVTVITYDYADSTIYYGIVGYPNLDNKKTSVKAFQVSYDRYTHNIVESDPNGKSSSDPGAKLDAGKNRLGLVLGGFARALEEIGMVGTAGAEKYSLNGWMKVPEGIERYTDAMERHWLKECKGEKFDPDLTKRTGKNIHHAACLAWNALARLDLIIREEEKFVTLPPTFPEKCNIKENGSICGKMKIHSKTCDYDDTPCLQVYAHAPEVNNEATSEQKRTT